MLVSKNDLEKRDFSGFKRKIKSSLKLLNHFEKIANVSKTKIVGIDSSDQQKYKLIFLFNGPSMWLSSPFLISTYSFLIRLGDKELEFDTDSDLEEQFKKLSIDHKDKKIHDNDAEYLLNSWDKISTIIKNRTDLFPIENSVHDVYWKDYNINMFHNFSGLNSLTKYTTMDKDLNIRMKKLMENH